MNIQQNSPYEFSWSRTWVCGGGEGGGGGGYEWNCLKIPFFGR